MFENSAKLPTDSEQITGTSVWEELEQSYQLVLKK